MEEILVNPTKEIRAGFFRIKNNFRRIDTLNRRSLHDKVILLFYYWSFFLMVKINWIFIWIFIWLKMTTVFMILGLRRYFYEIVNFWLVKIACEKNVHFVMERKSVTSMLVSDVGDSLCNTNFKLMTGLRFWWPFRNVEKGCSNVSENFFTNIFRQHHYSCIKLSPTSLVQGKSE